MLSSRGKRFIGSLLDGLIQGVLPLTIFLLSAAFEQEDETIALTLMGVAGVTFLVIQIVNWVMITQSGQSIAKRMLGMRIVDANDGSLPGFVRGVIVRIWAPMLISQFCSFFGLIDALFIFGDTKQCVHDHMATTLVVDTDLHQLP